MKKARIVCTVVTLVFAALTAGAVLAAKPGPGPVPVPINCRFVLCAYPDCLPSEHTVIPPGQCCPVCVPN
jgi:hypothetical protein